MKDKDYEAHIRGCIALIKNKSTGDGDVSMNALSEKMEGGMRDIGSENGASRPAVPLHKVANAYPPGKLLGCSFKQTAQGVTVAGM